MLPLPDSQLADRLARQGGPSSPEALRDLMAGIAASDTLAEGTAWQELLTPQTGLAAGDVAALTAYIGALRAAFAADVTPHAARLAALRAKLAEKDLDGFLVPRTDCHQGEYVAAHDERLRWLTGFTGSAGLAAVLRDKAAMFVDGRYTLQLRAQVSGADFSYHDSAREPVGEYLAAHLQPGQRFAYDPWLITPGHADQLARRLSEVKVELVALATNPVDAVWAAQPPRPLGPVIPLADRFTGRSSREKRLEVARALEASGAVAAVISATDALSWLLNMRGADITCTPVPLAHGVLHRNGALDLFIDARKLTPALAAALDEQVTLQEPEMLLTVLEGFGGQTVRLDAQTASDAIRRCLKAAGASVVVSEDLSALPKACKNEVELQGIRAAHLRDGVALARFFSWLDRQIDAGAELTELMVERQLFEFRAKGADFKGVSFETIAGSGPHGAIVHYRCTEESNRVLRDGDLLLLDSGAQYLDGTTDVTRTVPIGTPSDEMRERFTLVLKGHIGLAKARFPEGTTGSQLDGFARAPLWQRGLDYDHGTGHGVGAFLSVHEGPQRIAKNGHKTALKPGMILSNEPGFYKEGAYGIRIENLVAVVKLALQGEDVRPSLGFETLTLAPIDRRLIDLRLLTEDEIAWLNSYHQWVREMLTDRLDPHWIGRGCRKKQRRWSDKTGMNEADRSFEHSESKPDQALSLALISRLGDEVYTCYAQSHKDIIDRFGRFPSRNEILGRESTPEELAFLADWGGF